MKAWFRAPAQQHGFSDLDLQPLRPQAGVFSADRMISNSSACGTGPATGFTATLMSSGPPHRVVTQARRITHSPSGIKSARFLRRAE